MKTFTTERLRLRPLTPHDLDDLYTLYSNPLLMQHITGQARSREETRQRLRAHTADHAQYGFGLCAAILKETGHMIGRCGLEPVPTANGVEGDIAWMFLPPYWGQGLATEFARAMIHVGFTELNLPRIFATAAHANAASIRVMQKAGMTHVHTTPRGVEYEILGIPSVPQRE